MNVRATWHTFQTQIYNKRIIPKRIFLYLHKKYYTLKLSYILKRISIWPTTKTYQLPGALSKLKFKIKKNYVKKQFWFFAGKKYTLKISYILARSPMWPTTKFCQLHGSFSNLKPKTKKIPHIFPNKKFPLFWHGCWPSIKIFIPTFTQRWLLIKPKIKNILWSKMIAE